MRCSIAFAGWVAPGVIDILMVGKRICSFDEEVVEERKVLSGDECLLCLGCLFMFELLL